MAWIKQLFTAKWQIYQNNLTVKRQETSQYEEYLLTNTWSGTGLEDFGKCRWVSTCKGWQWVGIKRRPSLLGGARWLCAYIRWNRGVRGFRQRRTRWDRDGGRNARGSFPIHLWGYWLKNKWWHKWMKLVKREDGKESRISSEGGQQNQTGQWKSEWWSRKLPAGPELIAGLQARSCILVIEAVIERKGTADRSIMGKGNWVLHWKLKRKQQCYKKQFKEKLKDENGHPPPTSHS